MYKAKVKIRAHKYWKRDPNWDPMQRTKQEWLPISFAEYCYIGLLNLIRKHKVTFIGVVIGAIVWAVVAAPVIVKLSGWK